MRLPSLRECELSAAAMSLAAAARVVADSSGYSAASFLSAALLSSIA